MMMTCPTPMTTMIVSSMITSVQVGHVVLVNNQCAISNKSRVFSVENLSVAVVSDFGIVKCKLHSGQ